MAETNLATVSTGHSFNGAATARSRMEQVILEYDDPRMELQWGRDR